MSQQQQHRLIYTSLGLLIGTTLGYSLAKFTLLDNSNNHKRKNNKKKDSFTGIDQSGNNNNNNNNNTHNNNGYDPSTKTGHDDTQHVGFLTGLVTQLWDYMNPAASTKIRNMLEPMLKDALGSHSRVIKIDLGSIPLRLDNVTVHDINRKDGYVQFDMDVLLDGTDDGCEMNFQMNKIGGKFGIKSIKLKGRMSMILKPLTDEYMPCFSAISYSFINQPELQLSFTGLASFAEFSYIDSTIQKIMNDTLANMIVLPQRLIYKVDENVSLLDVYQPPHGIVKFTLENGTDFRIEKRAIGSDDIPDVYCNISFGDCINIRTPTIQNSLKPIWNYSVDFLVYDFDQSFTIDAYDEDNGTLDPDDDLGFAHVTVRELLLSKDRRMKLSLRDKEASETTGAYLTVQCDLIPLLSVGNAKIPNQLSSPNQLTGVLAILVRQAFDIPFLAKDAATMVKVSVGVKIFATSLVKDAPGVDSVNPLYDCVFHVPLSVEKPDVILSLIQAPNKVLGNTVVTFSDLLKTPVVHKQQKMTNEGTTLEFSVRLFTASGLSDSPPSTPTDTGTPNSTPPRLRATYSAVNKSAAYPNQTEKLELAPTETRKLRLTAVRGHGFKVRKRFLQKDDVPDVYLKIRFGNNLSWQTSTMRNTITPVWEESKVFAFVSNSEVIQIEAWDQNTGRLARDDLYGSASVSIKKLLLDGGTSELELELNGKKLDLIITLKASLLD